MQHHSAASSQNKSVIQASLTQLLAEVFSSHKKNDSNPFELPLHGLVVHSKETRLWALALASQFKTDFNWLYPDSSITIETVELSENNEHIQNALLQCPNFWDKKKARFSFALTPGYQESLTLSDLRHRSPTAIPQLYCVPGTLPLSGVYDDNLLAGVHNTPMAAQEYIHALQGLIPALRTICLAYTPHPTTHIAHAYYKNQLNTFEKACMQAHVQLIKHTWDHASIYPQELTELLHKSDALITLDESAMHKHGAEVIKLCNALKKPLCASELNSVYAGAALGCGITAATFSKPLLRSLTDILLDNHTHKDRFRTIPMQNGMRYNMNGMINQGIAIDNKLQALITMKSVFDTDVITL
jgi:hypothetical protein